MRRRLWGGGRVARDYLHRLRHARQGRSMIPPAFARSRPDRRTYGTATGSVPPVLPSPGRAGRVPADVLRMPAPWWCSDAPAVALADVLPATPVRWRANGRLCADLARVCRTLPAGSGQGKEGADYGHAETRLLSSDLVGAHFPGFDSVALGIISKAIVCGGA